MPSNAQDSVIVQGPNVANLEATKTPTRMGAVATQDPATQQGPLADLRANLRDAFRSWSVGRRIWDRAQAWMVAHRSVRAQPLSGAAPTQQD